MLRRGTHAPEFTLPDQDGSPVRLSSLLGERELVLYFYPADFTPGCTREACLIRDMYSEIEHGGLNVVGVSPQPPETHRAFRERYRLPFTLLADTDRSVARLYGVVGPFGLGIRRSTFVIDGARVIRDSVLADFRIGKHESLIRRTLGAGPAQ
jgi:thioredoxin-dependent peroxiredoxin